MNQISPKRRVVLPQAVPELVTVLDQPLDAVLRPHPDVGIPKTFPPATRALAGEVLQALGAQMVPASRDVLLAWLWPIADGVEYTPTEDEFYRRLAALEIVNVGIPHVAWTIAAQQEGLRQWRKFPSVSAIVALVIEPVMPLLSRVRALRIIIGTDSARVLKVPLIKG